MSAPLFLDLSHTSHTRACTGVQRVARALRGALGDRALPVTFDPFEGTWRPLEGWEEENLGAGGASRGRGAHWPAAARLRGHLRRWVRRAPPLPAGTLPGGVLVPEIFSPAVASALPSLFARAGGPRVALFHDAIALQRPESAPGATVARFPAYLRELLAFDGVAAVSEDSRRALVDYWRWLGAARTPASAAIPLGLDAPRPGAGGPAGGPPTLLCVGTVEARKNHLALLEACEALWARGAAFRLRLIGGANAETGGPALERLGRLRQAGRPVLYDGPLGDDALEAAYSQCAFTVYPSLAEGFGLPVAESLSRGKPCACRWTGALGEVASGGGCADIGRAGPAEIEAVIERLLQSPAERAALEAAARGRTFKSWAAYAAELAAWMASLARRP